VHAALLAAVHPGNTPHGYNLTFAFPMLMFIVIAGALFLRFRGAHHVPGHVALRASRWVGGAGSGTGTVNSGDATVHAAVEPAGASAEAWAAPPGGTTGESASAESLAVESVSAESGQAESGQPESSQASPASEGVEED